MSIKVMTQILTETFDMIAKYVTIKPMLIRRRALGRR